MKPDLVTVSDLIGKPWRLGARGPDAYDCWGLVREILQRMHPAEPLPDWASGDMDRELQRALIAGAPPTWCEPVEGLPPGALLISEHAAHIAIVVGRMAVTSRRFGGVVALRVHDYAAQFPDLRAYKWRA